MVMSAGLFGVKDDWRACVREMGVLEVPSTRWALLVGSSRCVVHCWAAGWAALRSAVFSFVFCDRRPGMGKENLESRARPMMMKKQALARAVVCGVFALDGSAIQQGQSYPLSRGCQS